MYMFAGGLESEMDGLVPESDGLGPEELLRIEGSLEPPRPVGGTQTLSDGWRVTGAG